MRGRFDCLLPCPCCAGRPVVLVDQDRETRTVRIECSDCHMSTPRIVYARRRSYDAERRMIDPGLGIDLHRAREEAARIWCTRA